MSVDLDSVKNNAVQLAEDAISRDCMYSINSMPDIDEHDWNTGDPENFSTIAQMALCEGVDGFDDTVLNELIDEVTEHLAELFPSYD